MPKRKFTSDEMATFAETVEAESGTALWTKDGAAGDLTEIVVHDYPPTGETTMRAWSEYPDEDYGEPLKAPDPLPSRRESWASALAGAAPVLFIVALVAFVLAVTGYIWIEHDRQQSEQSADSTASSSVITTGVPYTPPVSVTSVPSSPAPFSLPPGSAPACAPGHNNDPGCIPIPVTTESGFSGRYRMTNTNPDTGQTFTQAWNVTSCGDGCARIVVPGATDLAHLVNGQWTWNAKFDAICTDGSIVPNAGSGYTTIDAVTLRGAAHITWSKTCADSSAGSNTNNIVLTKVD